MYLFKVSGGIGVRAKSQELTFQSSLRGAKRFVMYEVERSPPNVS